MKTTTCFACLIFTTLAACAQPTKTYHWKATELITDESGKPVAGAQAIIGYYTNSVSLTTNKITGTNGLFEFQHETLSEGADVSFEAKKEGYYSIWQQVNLQTPYDSLKWNIEKTLVLKKVGKPIAMYAKSVNLGMPVFDKPAGFDFMAGDWVAPYGKGIDTDIIFTAHLNQRAENDADYTLTVSFPKAGDGIQKFTVQDSEKGSGLRSPHEASAVGYQAQWVQTRSRKPGQPETGTLDPNRNYIFRVRTALDHQGNVVSARYGKIYGDFMQFTYYLNPTPNDRNIEFDPKQNLIGGIQSFEQATAH
jgi:hypothetical protein